MIDQRTKSLLKYATAHRGRQSDLKSMSIAAQEITLHKVKSAGTLEAREISLVENAMLVAHSNIKKQILGFMTYSRWAATICHYSNSRTLENV